MSADTSNGDKKQSEDKEYLEEKAERAVGRKHQVKWSFVLYLFLLFSCVGAAIYVIEYFQ